jgi:MFS family permease
VTDSSSVADSGRRPSLPIAYWSLVLTYLAVAVNMTVASVALPTISLELQASTSELAWIVNATPLASAAFILFAGAWGNRFGRTLLLRVGLVVFIVSAVLSSMATDPAQLIALRGLTGLGSALAMPAALALTFDVVDPRSRRTAVGIIGATQAGGALLGPVLAGAALVAGGWGWAFLVVVPLLLLALLGSWRIPASTPQARAAGMDTVGATLVAFVSVGLIYAAITASSPAGSATRAILVAVVVAAIALLLLVVWERRTPHPIFVGSALRSRAFWVPTLAIFVVQFVLGGIMFSNTQYVQLVLGFSALGAGLFLVPALLTWIVVSATAGLTARRFGVRTVTTAGLALAAAGVLAMSTASTDPSYVVFVVGLLLAGCMGVAPALMTHMAVNSYPEERRTVGSAINSAATRYGLAFGVAAFSGVLMGIYTARLLPSLTGLTADQAAAAQDSLGSALRTSESLVGDAAQALAAAARESYVSGFQVALVIAGIVLAVLAVIVALALRGDTATERLPGGALHE